MELSNNNYITVIFEVIFDFPVVPDFEQTG